MRVITCLWNYNGDNALSKYQHNDCSTYFKNFDFAIKSVRDNQKSLRTKNLEPLIDQDFFHSKSNHYA